MRKPQKAIQLTSYNELLGIDESVNPGTNQIVEVPLSELYPFKNHAVLVNTITVADNLHTAIWSVAAYTVILCFSLFKTGSLSKSIFNAH